MQFFHIRGELAYARHGLVQPLWRLEQAQAHIPHAGVAEATARQRRHSGLTEPARRQFIARHRRRRLCPYIQSALGCEHIVAGGTQALSHNRTPRRVPCGLLAHKRLVPGERGGAGADVQFIARHIMDAYITIMGYSDTSETEMTLLK